MAEKVIALACNAGMSTSLLVRKMQDAAKAKGRDYLIYAKTAADVDNMLAGFEAERPDVLMIGPQIGYLKKEIQKKTDAAGVPMDVINMQDYGMMKGDKVLAAAEKLMGIV
ncbi:MAG: PTS sugar transporter subunit IIB [Streptococcaceae bacterium]|jgi:PTS system cellobiose-specific IIB component|nr:PTS sugar transporter subunit IIB [Streptococcaceae bacterium]